MRSERNIIAIVEGAGDKDAVQLLIRRILEERFAIYDILVSRPKVANGKPNLIKNFVKFVKYAMIEGCAAILVLLDADRDCPVELARCLALKASALNAPIPIAVACAASEYEAWLVCSLSAQEGNGIRRRLEIPSSVACPEDVESIRDAKAWLTNQMLRDRAYKETADQVALTQYIAIKAVHERSRSFRRLCHAVQELAEAVDACMSAVTPVFR